MEYNMSDRTTISIGVRTSVGRALVEFMDFFFYIQLYGTSNYSN